MGWVEWHQYWVGIWFDRIFSFFGWLLSLSVITYIWDSLSTLGQEKSPELVLTIILKPNSAKYCLRLVSTTAKLSPYLLSYIHHLVDLISISGGAQSHPVYMRSLIFVILVYEISILFKSCSYKIYADLNIIHCTKRYEC